MSDRYVIISADAHAGLQAEGYRPYLDLAYHEQFDAYLTERHAQRDQALQMNYDYIMGWETENEEGLRGAWDIEQRDKELDADVILAAQALLFTGLTDTLEVATYNERHLARYLDARHWKDIAR